MQLCHDGVGHICTEALRPSDHGRYYPESSTRPEQKERRELLKMPECEWDPTSKWWDPSDAFCRCSKGCGARCPCAKNGIGCWYEKAEAPDGSSNAWGCGCKGRCTSAVPGYFCDFTVLRASRAARVRELQQSATPIGSSSRRGRPSSARRSSAAAAAAAHSYEGDEALTLDELADERRSCGHCDNGDEAFTLDQLVSHSPFTCI